MPLALSFWLKVLFQRHLSNMTCLHPVFAKVVSRKKDGTKVLSFRGSSLPSLALPCGKCYACLVNKQKEWRKRMELELFSRNDVGTFLTLTYNNAYNDGKLHKEHLQNFLKRFRNVERDFSIPLPQISYYAVGEYGKTSHRPHYHLALFGVDCLASDWRPHVVSYKDGFPCFASEIIGKIWKFGFNVVGELNSSTIGYVSKYITKPYKSEFSLKSQSLGVSPFVQRYRSGRSVSYHTTQLFDDSIRDGMIVLPSSGGFRRVGLPACFYNYVKRFNPKAWRDIVDKRTDWVLNHPLTISQYQAAIANSTKIRAANYQKQKGNTSL